MKHISVDIGFVWQGQTDSTSKGNGGDISVPQTDAKRVRLWAERKFLLIVLFGVFGLEGLSMYYV